MFRTATNNLASRRQNHEEAARKSATAKYLCRVRPVLKCQLNGKKKIRAINTYACIHERSRSKSGGWPQVMIC